MRHLLEVLKILDGGVDGNRHKVISYARRLADKLEEDGDTRSAQRIVRVLDNKPAQVAAAFASSVRPVDSESRLSLFDLELVPSGSSTVVLPKSTHDRVFEFVQHVKHADRLIANGVGVAPTMLLHGPPGCGKTELARYVASCFGLPLLVARSDSLISSYLGSTAKNIRSLFEYAAENPCVLFLDEFDAIAKLRDDGREMGELKRVVVSLLQNIDSLARDSCTLLLAATNHPHLLDPAIWRRFAYTFKIDLPDTDARIALFHKFLGSWSQPDREVAFLSEVAEGMSGSDIRQVCQEGIRTAIISDAEQVGQEDLLRRILQRRFPEMNLEEPDTWELRKLQGLSEKFSCRKMALLLGVSAGKVSRALAREGDVVDDARARSRTELSAEAHCCQR